MKPNKADELVPDPTPKDILDVLPDMIRIAEEGDEFDRTARMLLAKGWTEEDLRVGLRKLTAVSQVYTLTLHNKYRDIAISKMTGTRWASDLKQSLRWIKKGVKGLE
jgi:hypothetical protein